MSIANYHQKGSSTRCQRIIGEQILTKGISSPFRVLSCQKVTLFVFLVDGSDGAREEYVSFLSLHLFVLNCVSHLLESIRSFLQSKNEKVKFIGKFKEVKNGKKGTFHEDKILVVGKFRIFTFKTPQAKVRITNLHSFKHNVVHLFINRLRINLTFSIWKS